MKSQGGQDDRCLVKYVCLDIQESRNRRNVVGSCWRVKCSQIWCEETLHVHTWLTMTKVENDLKRGSNRDKWVRKPCIMNWSEQLALRIDDSLQMF